MKVAFAGTPAFAAGMLQALLEAAVTIPLVLTQPDRPRGRGQKHAPSPVKTLAAQRAIPVLQPATFATDAARDAVTMHDVDLLVVAAYGLILPRAILDWPRHGCLNVHASLLPRWRGAAPIQRSLLEGDSETGITLMQMDAGLDTGPMFEVGRLPIDARETAGTLESKLAALGARMLNDHVRKLARGAAGVAAPQPALGATYAAKIRKEEGNIEWSASATMIDRQVRAFEPTPGAVTQWSGERVKVWRARPVVPAMAAAPGTVVAKSDEGIVVACGEGALEIAEMQPAGGRRMNAKAFAAGRGLVPGTRFGAVRQGCAGDADA